MILGAVYICTEDRFPSKRLNQMLGHFPRKSEAKAHLSKIKFGDYIYVDHIADVVII
jgi:DNA-repair protein XRCC3